MRAEPERRRLTSRRPPYASLRTRRRTPYDTPHDTKECVRAAKLIRKSVYGTSATFSVPPFFTYKSSHATHRPH